MKIAARFLKFAAAYGGVSSKEGWLEIDIRAVDLDGVTKLYVNLDDVASVRSKRDVAASAMDAWDAKFGAKDDDGPPPTQ
jgi:hypothetical protein